MSPQTLSTVAVRGRRRVHGCERPQAAAAGAGAFDGFDRAYWLRHCEGYRVETANGRLGFVEEVRGEGDSEPQTLVVRAGRLGRRLLLVPAAEVAFIVPRAERLWLRSPVAIAGSEGAV